MKNKKERNKLYNKVQEIFDKAPLNHPGVCDKIRYIKFLKSKETNIYNFENFSYEKECNESLFPELFMFKDKDNLYWLNDSDLNFIEKEILRRIVVDFCIEMTRG
jgi:hypothetical protein